MTIESNNIRSIIEEAWKKVGIESGSTPGVSMNGFLEIADDNNKKGIPTTVGNWITVFDECGTWFANLASLLMFSLKIDPHHDDIRRRRVLTYMIGNITSQIIAIRRLVLSGLDVQAKQILRVLVENLRRGTLDFQR